MLLVSSCNQKTGRQQTAIKINDQGLDVYMKVMGLELPKDSLKLANSFYEKAIAMDSTNKVPYANLCNSFNLINDYKSSVGVCNRWLANHPDDIDFLVKRGMLHELLNEKGSADLDYAKSNKLITARAEALGTNLSAKDRQEVCWLLVNLFITDRSGEMFSNLRTKVRNLDANSPEVNAALNLVETHSRRDYINSINGYFEHR